MTHVFFGCWNKAGEGRDAVLQDILDRYDSGQLTHLWVLGDNYYSDTWKVDTDKEDKLKLRMINLDELREGFVGLHQIVAKTGCEITIGLGNHELDRIGTVTESDLTTIVTETPLKVPVTKSIGKKAKSKKQLFAIDKVSSKLQSSTRSPVYPRSQTPRSSHKALKNKVVYDLENQVCGKLGMKGALLANDGKPIAYRKQYGDTLFVMLNTCVFCEYKGPEITYGGELGEPSFATLIVMGHHPAKYTKVKNDAIKEKACERLHQYLRSMKDAFPDLPFTYVCADEHYYHERSFNGITQYIVGSGGTDLDPIPPERKPSDTLGPYRREHGYLVLHDGRFRFVSVEGILRATARKRKRKRKQTKKKKKRKKRTYRRRHTSHKRHKRHKRKYTLK